MVVLDHRGMVVLDHHSIIGRKGAEVTAPGMAFARGSVLADEAGRRFVVWGIERFSSPGWYRFNVVIFFEGEPPAVGATLRILDEATPQQPA